MFTFTSGVVVGLVGGLVIAYLAPKLWAKATGKVGKAVEKIRD